MSDGTSTTWITLRDLTGTLAELQGDAAENEDLRQGIEHAISEIADEYEL